MAVGVQLQDLVTDVRAELGHSLSSAQGLNQLDTLKHLIKRTEEILYTTNDWPAFRFYSRLTVNVDQYLYNYPSDVTFEGIKALYRKEGNDFLRLDYGIDPRDYGLYDSTLGESTTPICKWQHAAVTNQIEIWPRPTEAETVLILSRLKFTPMVNDSDTCTLDGNLISMSVAAELAARAKAADAGAKGAAAGRLLRTLIGQQESVKETPMVIGGGGDGGERHARIGIDYIPRGYGSG